MDLDRLRGMKVDELKSFLRLRGLKVTGIKDELVARVFVAIENNLPILRTAEEVQADIATEYQAKLMVDDTSQSVAVRANDWDNEEELRRLPLFLEENA